MQTFDQGDVIAVPFPYTDRSTTQRRPALVVSRGAVGSNPSLLWVVMITNAENRHWEHDVPMGEGWIDAGLPIPSIIRPIKIAVIESDQVVRVIGKITPGLFLRVCDQLQKITGWWRAAH
ncbi:MAG: type II toxin-antitoxin system PemK/MazF family toxin [Pseudonocardiaceae bacterium]